MDLFRILAGLLALGATGWGIFCLFLMLTIPCLACLGLLFLPGYLITFCYWRRFVLDVDNAERCWGWGLSALIKGLWLFCALYLGANVNDDGFTLLLLAWWFVSFAVSFTGMFLDRRPLND